jgi:cytochrome c biogenesis protein CcdA
VLASVLVIASLGLADSINPVTILIAIYLASTRDPRRRLAGLVLGVFTAYLLGGMLLLFASDELLHGVGGGIEVPHADLVNVVAGAVAIVVSAFVWAHRARLRRTRPPEWALRPGSALVLGAAVTAIDLPTAFPYFGAVAVVVTSGASLVGQILLLVLFNALYVLPLALVLLAHVAFGDRCEPALAKARAGMERLAAPLLSGLTLSGGCVLVARGASGLI